MKKKGDVGMVKHSLKKGKKGWAFIYPVPAIQSIVYVKMPVSAWICIPTLLPQEQQAPKSNAFSGKDLANGVFSILHSYFETLG